MTAQATSRLALRLASKRAGRGLITPFPSTPTSFAAHVSSRPQLRHNAPNSRHLEDCCARSYATSPRIRTRGASAAPRTSSQASGVKVGTLFLALSILGLGATSVGLYNYYTSMKTFPPAIRTKLRSALRCKASGDYVSSDRFFHQAWEKAISPELVHELGLIKVTGIAASWSEMLEVAARRSDEGKLNNPLGKAYEVLHNAFDWAREKLVTGGTEEERMRTVALAVKMADMAGADKALEDESESQLTWAVEEVLRLSTANKPAAPTSGEDAILVADLDLPPWVSKTDLGGTLEALGNLYARKGNVEYAMPLYLQTISLLMPPPKARKTEPTVGEKCHAAMVMNNLSSMIAASPAAPSREISKTAQAAAWASKAASIAESCLTASSDGKTQLDLESDQCKPVLAVALYNLGMIANLDGKKDEAKQYLVKAQTRAREFGIRDADTRATQSLKSL